MTLERLKEIREWAEKDCGSQHPIYELLTVVDQLIDNEAFYFQKMKDLQIEEPSGRIEEAVDAAWERAS